MSGPRYLKVGIVTGQIWLTLVYISYNSGCRDNQFALLLKRNVLAKPTITRNRVIFKFKCSLGLYKSGGDLMSRFIQWNSDFYCAGKWMITILYSLVHPTHVYPWTCQSWKLEPIGSFPRHLPVLISVNHPSLKETIGKSIADLSISGCSQGNSAPVLASQTWIVVSGSPVLETILDPSGENATDPTQQLS